MTGGVGNLYQEDAVAGWPGWLRDSVFRAGTWKLSQHKADGEDAFSAESNLLGECPIWCDCSERLWWVDVLHPARGAMSLLLACDEASTLTIR
jgi:hypothetical protein